MITFCVLNAALARVLTHPQYPGTDGPLRSGSGGAKWGMTERSLYSSGDRLVKTAETHRGAPF